MAKDSCSRKTAGLTGSSTWAWIDTPRRQKGVFEAEKIVTSTQYMIRCVQYVSTTFQWHVNKMYISAQRAITKASVYLPHLNVHNRATEPCKPGMNHHRVPVILLERINSTKGNLGILKCGAFWTNLGLFPVGTEAGGKSAISSRSWRSAERLYSASHSPHGS